jgi:peptide/nickel transport system substrate-binding protein
MRKKPFLPVTVLVLAALVLASCGNEAQSGAKIEEEGAIAERGEGESAGEGSTEEPVVEEPELLSVSAGSCDYGGAILSIEATDMQTVVFTFCKPEPAFREKAALTSFGIYSSDWLQHAATAAASGNPEMLLTNPVGTGPYALEEWLSGDSVIFTRFDDYWGDPAHAETAVLRWAAEPAARLLELQSGTVDYITNVSQDQYEAIHADPRLQLLPAPRPNLNVLYLAMTNTFEPFGDPMVRQAIAMGIDRQRIVDNFFPEGSDVPIAFTPCSITNACQGEEWYEFDPGAGHQLLADAGYPEGFETTIFYRDVSRLYLQEPGAVAQEIQTQFRENLGITAEVEVMESGQFIAESTQGRLDGLYLLGWIADFPHITNFLDFHFNKANPMFGKPYPEIYEVLEEAATIADPEEAAQLYEEANNAIKELAPMVPIAHGTSANAALQSLGNAYTQAVGGFQFAVLDPEGDTLVFMQNAEPISLYCADEADGESLLPCAQVVEPLLSYELASGKTQPALATSCEPSDDATVWTCDIREGVAFHDGTTLDANDVVLSWAAGIDASHPLHVGNTGSFVYYAYLWDGLINAEE